MNDSVYVVSLLHILNCIKLHYGWRFPRGEKQFFLESLLANGSLWTGSLLEPTHM